MASVNARLCAFGKGCRFGLSCFAWHSDSDRSHFRLKRELLRAEWGERCGHCRMGTCKHGSECRRQIRSECLGRKYEVESDYESEDVDSKDECETVGERN